ncbi:MAG: RagB/SusD family nutrient uptake outer membrane protein [Bacteroidetes bacterium]|nr:RagB/SusD family nutrient uptake outer membrane protein [Bacteroidota bacterium]
MKKGFILLAVLLLTGCEGFLDEDIRSTHNYDNYFHSEDDLVMFSNGMFGGLITWTWEGGGLFFNNYWVIQDLASDNCFEMGPSVDMHDLSKFTFDPNNTVFDFIWRGCYFLINSANVLLVESENITEYSSPEVRNHLQGEAYFMRGMLYFELVKLFGDIPLQTFPTTTVESSQLERSAVSEVYETIISDLEMAEELLAVNPFSDRQLGMPTPATLAALLGKVYLTRGALNKDPADFISAKSYLDKVVGQYELETEFSDIFKFTNANKGEILWAVNFSGTLGEGWTTNQFLVRLMPTTISSEGIRNGQGWERPSPHLFDSYFPGDKRKDATFITEFDGEDFGEPYIQKYWDREAEPGKQNGESDADFIYMRYADVLLMYAEALNEINNGPDDAAYDAMNQVRFRAGISDLSAGLTYQEFKDSILVERRWEFVMEGHRWYDLVRFGKLHEAVLEAKPEANVKDHHILFPIPQKERYYNPLLTQNDGYSQ